MELVNIKGVGEKTCSYLNKLGIYNVEDLVNFYPYRYDVIKRSDLNLVNDGDKIIIDGIVENIPNLFYFKKNMNKLSFKLNSGDNLFNVSIFNRGYLKSKINCGTCVTVIGKLDKKKNSIVASNIMFGMIEKPRIEPVYHTTSGIGESKLRTIFESIKDLPFECIDCIPDYLCSKYNFLDKKRCIQEVHFPSDINLLKRCMDRLKYEELLIFMLKMHYLKNNSKLKIGLSRSVDYICIQDFISSLPFSLTEDQLKCIDDIYNDLIGNNRMNRLLQGDVGSGKTIVAIIGLYINYLSGYQGALMAPTEILAHQHYKNMLKLFKNTNIRVELLTGGITKTERKKVLEKIENGDIDIIVGTHALFTDDVIYKNLGLVITDEQHRFGVNQRGNLKNKGITADVLYMSATPIPRTYALTLYGDMDVSNISVLPNGRKSVKTYIKKEEEIKDVLETMYGQLKQNHQIYVIAPLVEMSDSSDLNDVYKLEENMTKAFGKKYNIGVLHGKLKQKEKDLIMDKFKNNEIQILISTTVIEVGVDVENATMIVIFDADRFGLSALHQLRGRVGRNNLECTCCLITDKKTERLDILTRTNDGFKISEEDFKLRGSGDLFGIRQSGDMTFKLADIKRDFNILLKAKEDAKEMIEKDLVGKNIYLYNILNSMNLD